MACVTSLKKENIKRCASTEIGFRTKLNYALQSDFSVTPLAPLITDSITNADAGTAVGLFTTIDTTTGFATIDVFMDKPLEENIKLNGKSLETSIDFYIQNNAEGKGFIRKFKNAYMLFAPESINGDFILVGDSKTAAAIMTIEGKNSTENYIKFTIQCMPYIALHWPGPLPMMP